MPSRLALPIVPDVSAPTGLPPCPGLRGEPCRDYQPFENRAGTLSVTPTAPGDTAGGSRSSGSHKKKCKKGKRASQARKKCKKKKKGK
ncbi:MAG TPA: hypothetical protein VLB79_00675 [Solirubrobacterales bacterium]|nr:hypothetical protein [Solirubrobacterales bacterium]